MAKKYDGYLCGYKCRAPKNFIQELEFPIEAYKAFCAKTGLSWPFEEVNPLHAIDRPRSSEPSDVPRDENAIDVAEGITVGELRQYLAQDHEEFIPRLLALLIAKKRLIKERKAKDKQGFLLNKSEKALAERVAKEEYKKLFGYVNDTDAKAIARCLLKDEKPANGTGGSY